MQAINTGFKKLLLSAEQKLRLDAQLLELLYRQAELEKTVFQKKVAARNEQEDVEKLKGFSVKGLLLGLAGKKEDVLEKERSEADQARMQYDAAANELREVGALIKKCSAELAAFEGTETALRTEIQTLLPELREGDVIAPEVLLEKEMQIGCIEALQTDLEEVCQTGEAAKQTIRDLTQCLTGSTSLVRAEWKTGTDRRRLVTGQELFNRLREQLSEFKEEVLDLDLPQELRFDLHAFFLIHEKHLLGHYSETTIGKRVDQIFSLVEVADWQIDAIMAYVRAELQENGIRLQAAWVELGQSLMENMQKNA